MRRGSEFIGSLNEVFPYFLVLLGIILISLFHFVLVKVLSPRVSARISQASPSELRREDDVLLQAVAFSQSLLLFLVSQTIQNDTVKYILIGLIAIFAVAFYAMRAWAKIKDSPRYRYYSMYILALVAGISVVSIGSSITNQFMPLSAIPFFPNFLLLFLFLSTMAAVIRDLLKNVFRKRYGYNS